MKAPRTLSSASRMAFVLFSAMPVPKTSRAGKAQSLRVQSGYRCIWAYRYMLDGPNVATEKNAATARRCSRPVRDRAGHYRRRRRREFLDFMNRLVAQYPDNDA